MSQQRGADSPAQLFVRAASTSGGPSGEAGSGGGGGCPVSPEERDRWLAAQRQQQQQQQQKQQQQQQQQQQQNQQQPSPGCPASEEARHAARINMPFVPNAPTDAHAQQAGASASASAQLSTQRLASSIPIADPSTVPQHQQAAVHGADGEGQPVWMYPSEQQFFNAMARKGWQPQEADMPAVVAIHNAVNERAWQHVLAWEALHACDCPAPKLLRFKGRPADFSPKARFLNLLGYKLPFDRHDWVVDRCGTEVRYVIDFYSGTPSPGTQASMHLDVRPALDSFGAALDRVRMQWRWVASGRWREP